MKLFKYSFKSKLAFTKQLNKIKEEIEISEDEKTIVYNGVKAIIELGFQQNGVDENDEPILGTDYCVDIIWKDDKQTKNFEKYEVFPSTPNHKISGW